MPDIHIRRDHTLGLSKARKLAWEWAEQAEEKFEMECTVIEGKTCDTVEFVRSGVTGQLTVAGDHFEIQAKLGLLFGAFSKQIESEIEKNFDALLVRTAGAPAKKAARKKTG